MSKKARKEGNKVASLIKANKAEFYITDVDLEDNEENVKICIQNAVRTLGKFKSCFMVISAGLKRLIVCVYIPNEFTDKINGAEWIDKSTVGLDGCLTIELNSYLFMSDVDFPFKMIDQVRANGFRYLKLNGIMEDEESSEEFIGFDDL